MNMYKRVYSKRFLMLRNNTRMVVPRAFHLFWRFFALEQIKFDAYCTMVQHSLYRYWLSLQYLSSIRSFFFGFIFFFYALLH